MTNIENLKQIKTKFQRISIQNDMFLFLLKKQFDSSNIPVKLYSHFLFKLSFLYSTRICWINARPSRLLKTTKGTLNIQPCFPNTTMNISFCVSIMRIQTTVRLKLYSYRKTNNLIQCTMTSLHLYCRSTIQVDIESEFVVLFAINWFLHVRNTWFEHLFFFF